MLIPFLKNTYFFACFFFLFNKKKIDSCYRKLSENISKHIMIFDLNFANTMNIIFQRMRGKYIKVKQIKVENQRD